MEAQADGVDLVDGLKAPSNLLPSSPTLCFAVPTIAINIAAAAPAHADTGNSDTGPTNSRIPTGAQPCLHHFPRPPESDHVRPEQQECGVHAGTLAGSTGSGLVYYILIHAASGPQLL